MNKYRKKGGVVEAFQMTKDRRKNNADWPDWMHLAWNLERETTGALFPVDVLTGPTAARTPGDRRLCIGVSDGQILVDWGDYIIKAPASGELRLCKPDIFEKTYEAV